jgi:hypothetical protein
LNQCPPIGGSLRVLDICPAERFVVFPLDGPDHDHLDASLIPLSAENHPLEMTNPIDLEIYLK